MEISVQSAVSITTVVHTTLVTTLVGSMSNSMYSRNPWSTLSDGFDLGFQGEINRPRTVRITIGDTPQHLNTKVDISSSVLGPASSPVFSNAHSFSSSDEVVQAMHTHKIASSSVLGPASSSVLSSTHPLSSQDEAVQAMHQSASSLPPFNPSNSCPLNTDPINQQFSSFESCQKTTSPGGTCCFPSQAKPSTTLSTVVSSTPASTLVSLTIALTPSPSPATSLSQPSTSTHSSPTLVSNDSATTPSTNPSPLPTELTTAKQPTKILPILIPCALAGAGIVAFGIWCVLWRDKRRPAYNPPMPVDSAPKTINDQKVSQGGNFAMAAAFHPSMGEMARKDGEGLDDEEKPAWKAGYRKYRDSTLPGSGLLKSTKMRELIV